MNINNYDTYAGWKRKGRQVNSGEKALQLKDNPAIFHISQTREVKALATIEELDQELAFLAEHEPKSGWMYARFHKLSNIRATIATQEQGIKQYQQNIQDLLKQASSC